MMFCSFIEEYSILYMENGLDSRSRKLLTGHINSCDKCRLMFNLIKANYHAEENVIAGGSSLSKKINELIDKNRYPVSRNIFKPFTWKKVLLVSIIFTLFIFASANAKTIYKTYKELMNTLFMDRTLYNITELVHTGIYSDKNHVKSVYEKYQDEIKAFIDQMKTAEISNIKFKEDGKSFKVRIAKGIKGDFISYGFEGYTIFQNDFLYNYSISSAESLFNNRTEYTSIGDLLGAAGICPVPGYIPAGYNLVHSYQSTDSKGGIVPESLGLVYRNSMDESLFIALTRSKMTADYIGMPGDLKAAAGLSESASQLEVAPDNTGNATSPSVIQEALDIGEYQAIYTEENIYSSVKDGTYKTFRTISIFLGDSAKLPILRIESTCLDKEALVTVAKNIEIANLSENQKKADDYFRSIEDEKILAYTDSYLDNIRAGKTEFKFKIDKDTEFYKLSYNDTYYITYRNVGTDKLKSVIQIQIKLNEDLLKRFEYADVQILGRPYSTEKTYSINLRNKHNASLVILMDRVMKLTGDLELTDQIIARMSGIQNEVKPLFSSSGHLYYLIDSGKRSWVLQTMYEVNGMARNYNFHIDKEILADEKALMDFINSL